MEYKKAYKEIESLLKYGEQELKFNAEGEQLFIPDTLETLRIAKMAIGAIKQITWERDLAISQLNKLGYDLGEKIEIK